MKNTFKIRSQKRWPRQQTVFQRIGLMSGLLLWALGPVSAQPTKPLQTPVLKAIASITAAECLDHVQNLANDACEGRATGSDGFVRAARYLQDQFQTMRLKTTPGDSSYWQLFSVDQNVIGESIDFALEILLSAPSGKDTLVRAYEFEKDFLPIGSASTCNFNKNIVFAGYGISAPENKWDDYQNLDVKDKLVLILSGVPPLPDANWGRLFHIRKKAEFAEQAGAAGIIIVDNPIGTISNSQSIPGLVVRESVADELLKGTGQTIRRFKQIIEKKQKPYHLNLPLRVRIKISSALLSNRKTMNILGYLEGSDPILKRECIVLGAHADHLGQLRDLVFYGANDNASGTATLLEVAKAFAQADTLPRRSILFIAFTGEEMGLLGSKYYVEHPAFPIAATRAMINLDMVGSGDGAIMIVGGHDYPDFAKLFDAHGANFSPFPLQRRWSSPNSDHFPFHEAGIPAVFLYAMNGVSTYHSRADRPETLTPEVMEATGRLVFRVLWDLANQDDVVMQKFFNDLKK